MTPRVFRLLLVGFWLLFGAYFIAHSATAAQVPSDITAAAGHQAPVPVWQGWIGGLNLLVSIWNTWELIYFKRRARWIFVAWLAIGLVNSLWGPITVEAPAALLAMLLQSMVAGALIVAMFFSPIAGQFARRRGDAA